MFHVYKNGICISGVFEAIYTNDPEAAYRQMHTRLTNNRYFYYRAHPDWAKFYSLRNMHHHIDMGKPYEQAVTVLDPVIPFDDESTDSHGLDGLDGLQKGKDPHGLDGLNGCDEEDDDFYDPLDHPDRERHLRCDDHPNDHFGE